MSVVAQVLCTVTLSPDCRWSETRGGKTRVHYESCREKCVRKKHNKLLARHINFTERFSDIINSTIRPSQQNILNVNPIGPYLCTGTSVVEVEDLVKCLTALSVTYVSLFNRRIVKWVVCWGRLTVNFYRRLTALSLLLPDHKGGILISLFMV